jgi:hypothetical protein
MALHLYLAAALLLALPRRSAAAPPDAASLPADAAPVRVTRGARGRASLAADGGATCTLLWDARAGAAAVGDDAAADAPTADEAADAAAVAALGALCVSSRAGVAPAFTACLGPAGAATQAGGFGADAWSFSLGTRQPARAGAPAARVDFAGGDACGGTPRSAALTLACGAAAEIVAATEPAQCAYQLVATVPALCARAAAFPLPAAGSGGGGGGGGGGGAPPPTEASANAALLRGLPAALRAGLEGRLAARAPAGATEDGAARAEALDEGDVAGAGGRSLGADDAARHGARWAGLGAALDDDAADWTLEAHAAAPAAQGAPRTWRCAAWAVDDLRRGGARGGGGGAADGAGAAAALRGARLELWPRGAEPPPRAVRVAGAVARGHNRERLATRAAVADGGASVEVVWDAAEGAAPLAYIAVTVEEVA